MLTWHNDLHIRICNNVTHPLLYCSNQHSWVYKHCGGKVYNEQDSSSLLSTHVNGCWDAEECAFMKHNWLKSLYISWSCSFSCSIHCRWWTASYQLVFPFKFHTNKAVTTRYKGIWLQTNLWNIRFSELLSELYTVHDLHCALKSTNFVSCTNSFSWPLQLWLHLFISKQHFLETLSE